MKIKVIACEVMKEEMLSIKPLADEDFEFVSMDYHLYPQKLGTELQNIIDRSVGYDRIILAFGLCGGAANGLKSSNCKLTIPKVHDCISVFLSHGEGCVCDFKKEVGTFYLSCGWMITEKSILSDHKRILEKFGSKKAFRVLNRMYDGYKKVLFIRTGYPSEDEVIDQSKEIASLISCEHEIIQGKTSFIEKIIRGPWDDTNFINKNPLGILTEEDFGIH
ncbi:DUF1638 domain-containing protein [Clostridium estertheticum]|uniref:DUF1638 domain-containing protein n=1 Tax=Clostridium estertheticum TaxID=238834 RepID=UPI001CF42F97|nr:DUF1638 domain-containing protein [Clostridium estertheticum]MCB2361424.1 DUF1638 domain-containing protein [Clostridium estertheticum]